MILTSWSLPQYGILWLEARDAKFDFEATGEFTVPPVTLSGVTRDSIVFNLDEDQEYGTRTGVRPSLFDSW